MNEMVERVAKGMYEKESGLKWEKCTAGGKLWWLKAARAAIETMKEPTEKMTKAGNDVSENQCMGVWVDPNLVYYDMIQAALDDV